MTSKKKSKKSVIVIPILIILIAAALTILAINLYLPYTYPLKYSEIIEESANEHGLDKFLIYAVIKTESGFNPDAVSSAGARGLMQIMPDTFEWIRDYRLRENSEDLNFDDMFTPENNIRYGAYLIAYHMKDYNNTDCSLAAYHAGNGEVNKWLADSKYSSDGKTLHTIPIPETSHYVNKVNKAYQIYQKLYS